MPPAGRLVRAFGSGVPILTHWAAFGASLATLFRSTALSVKLVHVLVFETLVSSLPIRNQTFRDAREFFPGQDSIFLANPFAEGPFVPPNPPAAPGQVAVVVAAHAIAAIVVAAVVFSGRDGA